MTTPTREELIDFLEWIIDQYPWIPFGGSKARDCATELLRILTPKTEGATTCDQVRDLLAVAGGHTFQDRETWEKVARSFEKKCLAAETRISELERELNARTEQRQDDAVVKDAERYRYMRQSFDYSGFDGHYLSWHLPRTRQRANDLREQLDKHIDLAIERTNPPKPGSEGR